MRHGSNALVEYLKVGDGTRKILQDQRSLSLGKLRKEGLKVMSIAASDVGEQDVISSGEEIGKNFCVHGEPVGPKLSTAADHAHEIIECLRSFRALVNVIKVVELDIVDHWKAQCELSVEQA